MLSQATIKCQIWLVLVVDNLMKYELWSECLYTVYLNVYAMYILRSKNV